MSGCANTPTVQPAAIDGLEEQITPWLGLGYLLFSFSFNINTTNVANAIANINASNMLIGLTPFHRGISRPPSPFQLYRYILPYFSIYLDIKSKNSQ